MHGWLRMKDRKSRVKLKAQWADRAHSILFFWGFFVLLYCGGWGGSAQVMQIRVLWAFAA